MLTFSLSDEIITMLWSGSPSDAVVGIKFDSGTSFLLVDNLETVVVDEHVGGASLQLISGDGLFNGLDCWCDDGAKALLVDGALNGDVW